MKFKTKDKYNLLQLAIAKVNEVPFKFSFKLAKDDLISNRNYIQILIFQ